MTHVNITVGNRFVISDPWLAKYTGAEKYLGDRSQAHTFLTPVCGLIAKHHLMKAGVDEKDIYVHPADAPVDAAA